MRALLRLAPVIPVLTVERVEHAVPLARALVSGGLHVLEVTLRTPCALDAIRAMHAEVPEAVLGAGTITRPEELSACAAAGALFGVTPGLTDEIAASARRSGWPLLPGIMTPTELISARAAGFLECKLFPAQQAGGPGMLRALSGPFPDQLFCPTGGVTLQNAAEYLALPNVPCVGGSWIAPADALEAGDWKRIERLAAQAAALRPARA